MRSCAVTHGWLLQQGCLCQAPCRCGLSVGSSPEWRLECAGGLTRAEGQDRIDFLAQVRNAALEPLWREAVNGSAWGAEGGFKADRIAFINDVYFCARDIVSDHHCHMLASLPLSRARQLGAVALLLMA